MKLNKYIKMTDLYLKRLRSTFDKFMTESIDYIKCPLIYGIRNTITDQWYIGQTKDLYQRLWNTRNRDGHCQKLDDKTGFIYENGIENFTLVILIECESDELDFFESYFCDKYDSYNNGYNKSKDGKGRWQLGLVYWINPNTREELRLPKGVNPPEGFILGNTTLGRKCYINRITGKMIKLLPDDEIPKDFIEGNSIKGMKVYRNEITGKVIRLRDGDPIPKGFTTGNNTTGKLRVYSIVNRKRYTLSIDDIKNSSIDDLRLGCPKGEFWKVQKWIDNKIINKSEI